MRVERRRQRDAQQPDSRPIPPAAEEIAVPRAVDDSSDEDEALLRKIALPARGEAAGGARS